MVKLSLSVLETLRGTRLLAVTAATPLRKVKQTQRTVVVGSGTATLAGGGLKRIKLTLNGTGKQLLRRRHRLTTRLAVTQTQTGGHKVTIATRRLTFSSHTHKPRRP